MLFFFYQNLGFSHQILIFFFSNSNVLCRLIQWKNAKYQQIAMLIVKKQMIIWDDFKDDYKDFTIIRNFIKSNCLLLPLISIVWLIVNWFFFSGQEQELNPTLSLVFKMSMYKWYQRQNNKTFLVEKPDFIYGITLFG